MTRIFPLACVKSTLVAGITNVLISSLPSIAFCVNLVYRMEMTIFSLQFSIYKLIINFQFTIKN